MNPRPSFETPRKSAAPQDEARDIFTNARMGQPVLTRELLRLARKRFCYRFAAAGLLRFARNDVARLRPPSSPLTRLTHQFTGWVERLRNPS
jgi:hypothetical protein